MSPMPTMCPSASIAVEACVIVSHSFLRRRCAASLARLPQRSIDFARSRCRGLPVAEPADEHVGLGAVEHDRRSLAVFEGAEPEQRGGSGGAYLRAVLMGVDDERRAELRGKHGEGASCLRALLERARVVTEQDVDLAATGEA